MQTRYLLMLALIAGCHVHVSPAHPPPRHPPPRAEAPRHPPPRHEAPRHEEPHPREERGPASEPRSHNIVRAKEIRAGHVHARVIYAKKVEARDGRVGRVYEDREDERWERGRSDAKIETDEINADVIYVKELWADWVEAGEIHAKEVKIGRRR